MVRSCGSREKPRHGYISGTIITRNVAETHVLDLGERSIEIVINDDMEGLFLEILGLYFKRRNVIRVLLRCSSLTLFL